MDTRSLTSDADTAGEEHGSEERRKELEIWDAFKEEHHEILEQLPLSLHRQYTLIHELDDQSNAYASHFCTRIADWLQTNFYLPELHQQHGGHRDHWLNQAKRWLSTAAMKLAADGH
ncbi:hypothetical protein EV702DRAFT_1211836 [Suillus placidus]|uniref:Uncharacterized protein n=1 Tax=Suillus placidus TaxID=48579 RepID=A0A9P7A133_9AGAM|nr:hypothetical protein EV702DRAFT_1211836 [Suillus placidus]